MSSASLGVTINQTLVLHQPVNLDSSKSAAVTSFVNDLSSYPGIQSITLSTSVPGTEVGGSSNYSTIHSNIEKRCRDFGIDSKFIAAYGLELLAGRNFSTDRQGRETSVILNQAAVRAFGFASDATAIGEKIKDNSSLYKIIGVIKDYHQESLQNGIDPIVFYPEQANNMNEYSIKINSTDPKKLIEFARQKWNAFFPESPFSYRFLDDVFNEQYKSDRLFSTVLWLFTALAIAVACLGLFGLSLYTVAKRAKEISVRKVLGASTYGIIQLIAKDYLRLILIAGVPAIPIAYYVLRNWLDNYAFHISIGWWFIVAPIVLIGVFAMSTVIYHSLRAAMSNPSRNLRS